MVPALTLESGETIVDSDRIAMRLEECVPSRRFCRRDSRGLHLALTRYIDSEVEEALFCAAVPDEEKYFARQGADRLAMFRFIRDRKYGAGFCDRMEREHEANMVRVREVLEPFEMALEHGAFLTRRSRAGRLRAVWAATFPRAYRGAQNSARTAARARVLRPRRSDHGGAGRDGDVGDFDYGCMRKRLNSAPVESSATS